MTVTDVCNQARPLLNDVQASLYTDAVLLPFVEKAYRELQRKLALNGLNLTNDVSSLLTVSASVGAVINESQIADLIFPLELWERASGSSDLFIQMVKKDWEPETERTDTLRYWTWREDEIKMVGATADRQVKVKYRKALPTLTTGGSLVLVKDSKEFLAARASALASGLIGGNFTRAQVLNADAEVQKAELVSLEIKGEQQLPVRRRPFRAFSR